MRRCGVAAAGGALTAAFLLVYLGAISPHLVHHAFDADHADSGKFRCTLYAQSQLTTAEPQLAETGLGPPALTGPLPGEMPTAHPPVPSRYAIRPRAPPTL